ncbi:SRPBCC family protein [Antrihabitans sp. YC2-6]|uniref:SRPBCC family protein n=1 Tax=Antrihabitans sp. YC2-6 TaxID=2799498 RepID=UPI0018F5DDE4|nr:SRPBCC family protein [Antrihabitans sp. YC2-6]MBJ8348297.1 SRPBCC family protein [Antrihabitans sp. YC2-6]
MTTSTVSTAIEREIHVERVFAAPRSRVWAAFTKPDLLAQWWARGNDMDIERWEFERGGHWRFVERADGDTFGFEGRFREISPEDRLSYTFEWDGQPGHVLVETNTFVDLGDETTKLVVVSQFLTQEERDGMLSSGMESGMNESYAALDAVLARQW